MDAAPDKDFLNIYELGVLTDRSIRSLRRDPPEGPPKGEAMRVKMSQSLKKTEKPSTKKDQDRSEAAPRKRKCHRSLSTPTTYMGVVEGVEGILTKPQYDWQMESGLDRNFWEVGRLLGSLGLDLYQHHDGGLLLAEDGRVRRIASAKELAPLLIDNIRIRVAKNGRYHGERVVDTTLTNMLYSRHFLTHFRRVDDVVTTAIALADYTPSQPGYNPQGRILYLGLPTSPAKGFSTITKFLDVMEWESNADRTNAVAAALTVLLRHHFPGGKPLVLVTATKSHAGKGTIIEFIKGSATKADLLYQSIDWPMEKALQQQLIQHPETGVLNLDNVRIDSSGRGKIIRSGFLESLVTNSEFVLNSIGMKPVRSANRFVVLINTNEGGLSIDLLNRALPIRLAPTGDVTQRRSPIGNPKLEFLPPYQNLWAKSGSGRAPRR